MICMKVYTMQGETMIAACDEALLGKSFEEGELHISITNKFYGEDRVSKETFQEQLKEATIANLVGEDTIALAIELGLVDEESILRIDGVPHAQLVKMIL